MKAEPSIRWRWWPRPKLMGGAPRRDGSRCPTIRTDGPGAEAGRRPPARTPGARGSALHHPGSTAARARAAPPARHGPLLRACTAPPVHHSIRRGVDAPAEPPPRMAMAGRGRGAAERLGRRRRLPGATLGVRWIGPRPRSPAVIRLLPAALIAAALAVPPGPAAADAPDAVIARPGSPRRARLPPPPSRARTRATGTTARACWPAWVRTGCGSTAARTAGTGAP